VPLRVELTAKLPEGFPRLWDDGAPKLETRIAEIAAAIVAAGEARYRLGIRERLERIEDARQWQEQRRREAEAARNAERMKALRKSAEMLRAANDLRALLASVRAAMASGAKRIEPDALAAWERWANAEADRLDPVLSGQIDDHLYGRS
jgi:hypothetical protein